MHTHRRRGAGKTEYIIIVTVVAIVMILALTVYGQKIAALFKGSVKSLDRGQPFKSDPKLSQLDINTDTSLANPAGTTNPEVAKARGVPSIAGRNYDPNMPESERRRLEDAFNHLPPTVRDIPIGGADHIHDQNAYFSPGTNNIMVGPFIITPNGDQEINDFFYALTGQNNGWTLERVLYHEMMHAYQHHNAATVDSFLNIGYDAKYNALNADPAYAAARAENTAVWTAIQAAVPAGKNLFTGGKLDLDVLQEILRTNPALRDRLYANNAEITRLNLAHGLPSRYPGDAHAGGDAGQSLASGRAEYFAMVFETARHNPTQFAEWRRLAGDGNPANDVLSQAEIDWIDNHPELQ